MNIQKYMKMKAVLGFGSAREFSAILAGLPTGVVVLDEEGLVLFVNPVAARLLQVSAEQLMGSLFPFESGVRGVELAVTDLPFSERKLRLVSIQKCEPSREQLLAELRVKTRRLGRVEQALIRTGGRAALKKALNQ